MNNTNKPYRLDSKGNRVELTNVVLLAGDSDRVVAKLNTPAKPKLSAANIRGLRVR